MRRAATVADLTAGWYVIIRESDDSISCLYREEDGRWRIEPRYSRSVPTGWRVGPSVDDLMERAGEKGRVNA